MGEEITLNSYYLEHPENVLGAMELGHGIHGSATMLVRGTAGEDLAGQLRERLTVIVERALRRGQGLTATAASLTVVSPQTFDAGLITAAERGEQTPLYTLRYNPDTRAIDYWAGHDWAPNATPTARQRSTAGTRPSASA